MNSFKLQIGFFALFLIAILIANVMVFLPLISPIFLAVVSAVAFFPLYKWFRKISKSESFASILTVFVVLLVIILPITFFGVSLFEESVALYSVTVGQHGGNLQFVNTAVEKIETYIPDVSNLLSYADVPSIVQNTIKWFVDGSRVFLLKIVRGVFELFILVIALYYLLKDGEKLKKKIIELSPLRDTDDAHIINNAGVAINSVVRGHLLVAIIQGALVGIGFYLFGIPNPAIWSFVAIILSILPAVGTGLVLLPATVYVFFVSGLPLAIGFGIWSVIIMIATSNFLEPFLIRKIGMHIHPFFILVSVLGGIQVFGFAGLVAGPVILSLFFASIETYSSLIKQKNS